MFIQGLTALTMRTQIRMEYLIMNNLEAAMRDLPKPATFTPTAGGPASCSFCPLVP